jgi:hypothetical protein
VKAKSRKEAEESDKAATVARVAAMQEAEEKSRQSRSLIGSLKGGVAALLAELDLGKYVEQFASAKFDDDALLDLAMTIDEDKEEGAEAFAAMVEACGVRGGSVTKLRRRLLEFKPKGAKRESERGGDAGEGKSGKGGGGSASKGKGKGKGGKAAGGKTGGGGGGGAKKKEKVKKKEKGGGGFAMF